MNIAAEVKARNERIRSELNVLTHKFGNLELHLSGEGRTSFLGTAENGWVGFAHLVFDGDIGCMTPYPGYDVSALDNAFSFLSKLEMVPHLNMGSCSGYTVSKDSWKRYMEKFKKEIKDNPYQPYYTFSIKGKSEEDLEDVDVVTIKIKPLVNEFVSGEYNAAEKGEYLGRIAQVEGTGDDGVTLVRVENGQATFEVTVLLDKVSEELADRQNLIVLNQDNTTVYRGITPSEGDYLVKDVQSGDFVVIPAMDYPGSFH